MFIFHLLTILLLILKCQGQGNAVTIDYQQSLLDIHNSYRSQIAWGTNFESQPSYVLKNILK